MVALSHVVPCGRCHSKCTYFGETVPASPIKNPTGFSFRSCAVTDQKFFGTVIVRKFGRLQGGHWPIKFSKGRCKRCLKRNKETWCTMACELCGKRICLDCFKNHTAEDLA